LAGFIIGSAYAFILDKRRALKGLVIAFVILVLMYLIGLYYSII